MNLILEDRPAMAFWLKLIIALTLGITLVLGIVLYFLDPLSGLSMFILTIGLAALFYCILPRSYQIYTDRLKIVLGGPFRLTIPFATSLQFFSPVDSLSAVATSGISFTTSAYFVLEVKVNAV
jgi:hypothetical protein